MDIETDKNNMSPPGWRCCIKTHYFLSYQVKFKWNLCSCKKVKICFKSNENCWELTPKEQYLCKRRHFAWV